MRSLKSVLVTGGAGFIGVNFIRYLFEKAGFTGRLINLDMLTYAGNPASLADIEEKYPERYLFVRGDIRDRKTVERIFTKHEIDTVVHFAAESHVDRSILGPEAFITTNVMGTFTLLEASRNSWNGSDEVLFHHVSTDEVYGSLGEEGYFTESTPYDPRSPYSASKAGSDHLVQAYHHTYGLPVTLSNCSNNYGPYQFPEKLIPLMIMNMLEGKALPVYGDGKNIRDWLYVEDHASAVWQVIREAPAGESYNVGGENEWENITLLNRLIEIVAEKSGNDPETIRKTITYVKDRPGHDRRYAIDCEKIKRDLGWKQSVSFEEGLSRTVDWYLNNPKWTESIRSGEYQDWIAKNYGSR
ncbi:dTDP-glucose 4,6-dehydratase [Marispirochaeta aestuarii]|uniref:dTDP-glucose 4,6-dehydratase n=1 Tax=Marispirochaeta aestuarii TaxID=1963862 RepID=UPI0029C828C4|nr:dTDP-glucose 4,6-dehydratase [Marispirochaeta aestuarii]